MAINFPNSPALNDIYTEGNRSWTWNGVYWRATSTTVGYTGSRGYTGSAGIDGYTGSRGDDGTSVTIVGTVATSSALPDPYGGNTGDGYITEDDGHLWVWSGSAWTDVGEIRGYTGSIGYTGSRGSLDEWTYITSNHTATPNQRIVADTTAGTFTITLPINPVVGYYVVITDGGDWSTNPLEVNPDGATIEGYTENVSLDIAGVTVEFIWANNTWQVTATLGIQGDPGFTGSQGLPGEAAAIGYTGSQANLGAVDQSIIPVSNSTYDLGASNRQWRSLYVSSNTIFLGAAAISIDETSGALTVTNSQGDPVPVGGASVEVSDNPPLSPEDGNMWLDSTTGNFSVYVGGGWLKVGPGGGGSASVEVAGTAPSSPSDGNMWMNDETGEFSVYVGGAWLSISGGSGPAGYTGSQGASGELITWAAAQTANFTATANLNYIVDTTNNAVTVTLPSSPQYGDQIKIADGGGNATANNITITSPNNIMGTGDDFLLDLNWSAVQFTYYNATKGWIITGTS